MSPLERPYSPILGGLTFKGQDTRVSRAMCTEFHPQNFPFQGGEEKYCTSSVLVMILRAEPHLISFVHMEDVNTEGILHRTVSPTNSVILYNEASKFIEMPSPRGSPLRCSPG